MNIHYDPQPVDVLYIDIDTEKVSDNIHVSDMIVIEKGIESNSLTGFKFLCFEELDVVKELFEIQEHFTYNRQGCKTYVTKGDMAVLITLTNMLVKNWAFLKEVI